MGWTNKNFGLGYFNEDRSAITHFIWCKGEGEQGPYVINCYGFQTDEQFLELLQLIKSLGDQVHCVSMKEPPGFALQDFIRKPFKQIHLTRKTELESKYTSFNYMQLRILDMEKAFAVCSGRIELPLTVELTDPIEEFLSDDAEWKGLTGSWDIRLGKTSSARPGKNDGALVKTSVNALSRLWYGSSTARSLALQGQLEADADTVRKLDEFFQLPKPAPWTDF